ncbi:MAG TPA: ABC transporter permease [Thermoleophilaceae bacterium]|nr:ABC transporter permease [Thermoleophilaceae bacterium]
MRPSNIFYLYRVRLRSRLVQELLALTGIAVGVALVFAALVANTSLTGSMRELTEGIVGQASLQVASRGPEGFDQQLLREVRKVDGIAQAAPVLEVRGNVVGPNGRRSVLVVAGDPTFARLGGTFLPDFNDPRLGRQRALALPAPMAASLGLSLGQPVRLEVDTRVGHTPLGARLQEEDIGDLVDHPVVLAPLEPAQMVTQMEGRVTRIFVKADPGEEAAVETALRRIAPEGVDVKSADADITAFEQAAYPTNQSTALFSMFSALVGFLFAFSAVLLTVPQRRRLVADLRMAGHDAGASVALLLLDALVLGAVGALLGVALGDQLSRHLFESTPGYLSSAFAIGSQRIVTWQSLAIAIGAGVLASCLAVLVPMRDILARRPPRRTSRKAASRSGHRVAGAGCVCLAGTTLIVAFAPGAALLGIVLLTLGLLLLLPLLLKGAVRVFEVMIAPVRSVSPTLAKIELQSRESQTRTFALSATGAIAVFATVAIGGAHADLERGLDASARDIDGNADIWITFQGQANTLATTPFGDAAQLFEALRDVPGVRSARPYRGSFLDLGDHRVWVIAPPKGSERLVPASQIKAGDPVLAASRIGTGGWVTLSESIADELEAGPGDRIELPSPRPKAFRVAAVTTNLGWPPGAIVLNADDYAAAWDTTQLSALHVDVVPGVSSAKVAKAIGRVLGPRTPMLVETARQRTERHYALTRDGLSRLTQISALVLIAAALAMVATMGGMIWQRRPILAALKVHGYSQRELWSALVIESALLLGTACLAGAAFGLYGQVLLSRALETITGFPVFYATAGLTATLVLAVITAVAVAMIAVPGWLAARVRAAPSAAQ